MAAALPLTALPVLTLPKFVALKSVINQKYLKLTSESEDTAGHLPAGCMIFDGDEVAIPDTKFELVKAKVEGLVHIRCCLNNKYWVRDGDSIFIVATAEKPDEDQSKSSCTLFKAEQIEDQSDIYGFRHIQYYQKFACHWLVDDSNMGRVHLTDYTPKRDHLYTLLNWENLVVLPKRVAFKGDNGNYLSAVTIDDHPYQQFANTTRDAGAEYEVTNLGDGSVSIKSLSMGKFWRRSPDDWIWADTTDELTNKDTIFWPVKVGDDVVALRNLGNNNYCKRFSDSDGMDCLNAGTNTIETYAELVVEELVVSRNIYNIKFNLSNARIYNESLVNLVTGGASNESYGTESKTYTLKMVYKDIKTNSWNHNISIKVGVATKFEVAAIPLIVEGKIDLSTEVAWAKQWGETHTTETDFETSYGVTVLPRTKTTVTLVATHGLYDIPFSYTQSDVLSNGNTVIEDMYDGVFKGANYYSFHFDEKVEEL
ncbi:hypothetical protein FRX31_008229 [Thalictrum thalictroides]|uniref:Agglutinin domain-containing protein n=1 Tax=Thalictrum thalictroides TaxID=46969 RepID=A0A7J6X197_THATH|nr:hypothetical protein FRX31_008229 [Thalictrum thalictroides]